LVEVRVAGDLVCVLGGGEQRLGGGEQRLAGCEHPAPGVEDGIGSVGSSIGVAVTGSIVASTGAGFINSSHAAWAVLGGCGLVALALGVISTSS
jgi:hypothetical protein